MTSTPNTAETAHADQKELDQASPAAASEAAASSAAGSTFNPFAPETYAPKKNGETPWHQRNNKSNHDKRPHTPPRGTRRSMGKR